MKLRGLVPSRRDVALAALTAALLFLAYPPASLVLPSFVALVPFIWRLEEIRSDGAGPRQGFRTGFLFGLLVNGVVLYWMIVALWHFTPLSALGYGASIVIIAFLWGGLAWATVVSVARTGLPLWMVFPVMWTAAEWILGHMSDIRFPWLGLGTSLTSAPTLVQWADVAGARGVTLWLAWANVLLYAAVRARTLRPAVPVVLTVGAALVHGLWRERAMVMRPVTTVAVVQPNVGFDEKRRGRDNDLLVEQLVDMTRQVHGDGSVGLVAWPEVAVPGYFWDHPEWEARIGAFAAETGTPILTGGLDVEFASDGSYEYYNAAFLFDATGSARNQPPYRKRYLVPIVERVPFLNPRWFGNLRWFGGFGRGSTLPVYSIAEGSFGVLICYESAFEDLTRRYRRDGADFIVNVTNDAWFGRTAAPYQHAAHLVMRAIETRMGVARSANTGISGWVDPLGRTHDYTPLFTELVVTGPVMTTDSRTLYVRLGDWVGWLVLAAAASVLVAGFRRRTHTGDST